MNWVPAQVVNMRSRLRRALPCHDLTSANMSGIAVLGRARGAVTAQDSSTCHWGRRGLGEVYLAACITVSNPWRLTRGGAFRVTGTASFQAGMPDVGLYGIGDTSGDEAWGNASADRAAGK